MDVGDEAIGFNVTAGFAFAAGASVFLRVAGAFFIVDDDADGEKTGLFGDTVFAGEEEFETGPFFSAFNLSS